jgi:hypothetical protein
MTPSETSWSNSVVRCESDMSSSLESGILLDLVSGGVYVDGWVKFG